MPNLNNIFNYNIANQNLILLEEGHRMMWIQWLVVVPLHCADAFHSFKTFGFVYWISFISFGSRFEFFNYGTKTVSILIIIGKIYNFVSSIKVWIDPVV